MKIILIIISVIVLIIMMMFLWCSLIINKYEIHEEYEEKERRDIDKSKGK